MVERLTSEEAFEALDVMDVAVMIADIINDGSWVTWVNPAFTRVFGYTLEEMLDGALARIMGDETDMAEIERMYAEVRQGRVASVTTVGYCADGTKFWSSFTMSPVFAGEHVVRWVGVQHDVSEHIRRSQQDRRSYEIERRARVGLSMVGVVSDLMSEAENPLVLQSVAQVLSGQLVTWAGFFDLDGGRLRRLVGVDPDDDDRARRRERQLARAPSGDPIHAVLVASEATRGVIDVDAEHPPGSPAADLVASLRPHLAAHPAASDRVLLVPVQGRRRTLCVLAALPRTTDVREAESADEIATILELVARRVGLAMENAQLYAREHQLAETLQRAMLPEQLPVQGLDVWTYYAPSAEHAQVGGDWYDVVPVGAATVAVVIGDVTGHDVEAAATMGQLRSIVRAYAWELGDPAAVLDRVDRLVASVRVPRYASLVYASLTPSPDGGWDVAYSRAGHLPPLLVRAGEVTSLDGAAGSLIGFGRSARETAHVHVEPGDLLIFYTDGLVERRDRSMRDGVAALHRIGAELPAADAAEVGAELLLRLADAPEDDVAVVVVRVPEVGTGVDDPDSPRQRRWVLPIDARSIARARHEVLTTCAAWGVPDARSAELVVSELVANAVMHGWGYVGLRLVELNGDGMRIEVEDENPAAPTELTGHASNVGGFGLHIIGRLAEWGWSPTATGKVVWAELRSRRRGLPGGTPAP